MPVDVVVNRNARRLGDGSPLRKDIEGACRREGARLHVTGDLAALDLVADNIARHGTDGVVLAGGDGSTMAGVSALARAFGGALPPVGLAPGGTVGTIARNLGAGSGAQWATRLVSAACARHVHIAPRPTLRLAAAPDRDRVGFIFGAGLVARFFDEYYASPKPSLSVAARIAARVVAGSFTGAALAKRVLARAECTLELDGVARDNRGWSLILASVVRDVGLHVLATYRAGSATERFHAVASSLSPKALALQVPRVLVGSPMTGEATVDELVGSMRVSFDEPTAYVLDGELLRAGEVRITAGPALPLMVPRLENQGAQR
jgi:diacylglycerol kinase family enzyme